MRWRWRSSVAKRSSAAPRERDRLQQLGVAVARDDLRGDRFALQPDRPSTRDSNSGDVAEYVPTAPRDRADRRLRERALQPLALRCASNAKPASLIPNDVGSAWTPWVRPTHSVSRCSRARAANASTSRRAPGTTLSPARLSCSASAVSSTSHDVSP